MTFDMNAWLRQRAGYSEPEPEQREETVPPFNGGPRRAAPRTPTMSELLRKAAERAWFWR